MEDTFKKFIEHGEHIYPAPPDSVWARSGDNRIAFSWRLNDPKTSLVKIFWNSQSDSIEIPVVDTENTSGTFNAVLDNISEGAYSFDIYAYDDDRNQSIGVNVVARVYGSVYEEGLLSRLPRSAMFEFDTLKMVWDNPVSENDVGTKISYFNEVGELRYQIVEPGITEFEISDYAYEANDGSFNYVTLYLPEPGAVDTFSTATEIMKVEKAAIFADGHMYTCVFPDDPLQPSSLFFFGYPRGESQEMVWKYDLVGDSVLSGYPKPTVDEFNFPDDERVNGISAFGNLYLNSTTPNLSTYFFSGTYYFSYDLETHTAGPVTPINSLVRPWPEILNAIEISFWCPDRASSYLFAGDLYEKLTVGGGWSYNGAGRGTLAVWKGIPSHFVDQGFSGMYYVKATRTMYLFSRDEFITFDEPSLTATSNAEKIVSFFNGL